jgi:hypothetical protein
MRLALAVALALVFAGSSVPAQAFTTADFKGWYAFGFEGLENGDRVVSTGVMRLDGVGAVTGRWSMRRDGGGQCEGSIANSVYRINADGTGFFALGFFPDPPCLIPLAVHFASAARSVGSFEFASTQGVFSGRATRRGAGPFTTAGLAGTYAFRLSGPEGFTQTVAAGVMTLDGAGAVTGRATFKKDGTGTAQCAGDIRDSTYGVNTDGTGFMALGFFPDPGCGFAEAVLLSIAVFRKGAGFELASTFNALYSGTARRQVPPAP